MRSDRENATIRHIQAQWARIIRSVRARSEAIRQQIIWAGFNVFRDWLDPNEFEQDAIGIICELLGSQRSDISTPTKETRESISGQFHMYATRSETGAA